MEDNLLPEDVGLPQNDAEQKDKVSVPVADDVIAFDDIVSGRFDDEDANVALPKRVLLPQAEQPKLHKVLAQAGMGSRLEMEQLILEWRISVNNEPAHIGQRIKLGDQVKVNGNQIPHSATANPCHCVPQTSR